MITYFHSKVIESGSTAPSSDEVLRIVEQSSKVWQMSKLKGFSELRFQYEEEKEYELFFLPYVWSLGKVCEVDMFSSLY